MAKQWNSGSSGRLLNFRNNASPYPPLIQVRYVEGSPVDLETALGSKTVKNGVVDRAARVPEQVEGLSRTQHHAQVELAVEEQRFHRRYSKPPVLAQSGHLNNP